LPDAPTDLPAPPVEADRMKPLETHYADCRFRSRLEARWAVFFDQMSLRWEYEPDTYLVGGMPYLPDFWLPDLEAWAEVKGVLSQHDLDRLIQAVHPQTGLPRSPAGDRWANTDCPDRILILGSIPRTAKTAPFTPCSR
jgi:hypothetical protein